MGVFRPIDHRTAAALHPSNAIPATESADRSRLLVPNPLIFPGRVCGAQILPTLPHIILRVAALRRCSEPAMTEMIIDEGLRANQNLE